MDGRLAALSQWIDDSQGDRDPEAILWGRVSKITEEAGEAIAALIGLTGQNPRKGVTHTMGDLQDELLDVAVTALCAVEHINANDGRSMDLLAEKVSRITARAGLTHREVINDARNSVIQEWLDSRPLAAVGVPADQERNEP